MRTTRAAGFTLIELLVTITIIAILIGLLMPGLALLRTYQRKQETRGILNGMEYALAQYLDTYGVLGDNGVASAFTEKPWVYLGVRQLEAGKAPFIDPGPKRLKAGTPPALTPASQMTATQICDAWGDALKWEVTNGTLGARKYTSTITVWSTGGTAAKESDDLSITWTSDNPKWVRK